MFFSLFVHVCPIFDEFKCQWVQLCKKENQNLNLPPTTLGEEKMPTQEVHKDSYKNILMTLLVMTPVYLLLSTARFNALPANCIARVTDSPTNVNGMGAKLYRAPEYLLYGLIYI